MKKLLFALPILISCYFISCNSGSSGGLSATAQKNLDAMHGVQKCFDSKDFGKLGDFIAADAVDHAGESGDLKGLASIKAEFEKWASGNDNPKTEVIKELADDEYVFSWCRYTGTLKTPQMGLKAGDKYDMKAIELAKFKDGKAVEHWTFMEPAEMIKMMGKMEQPQMPMPADSPKVKKEEMKKM